MNNDTLEAIKKRNHDMWWRLNGHGVMCWINSHEQGELAFKQCAIDIDALLDEIQRRHAEAEQFMVRIQELRAREQILEQQRDLLGEPVCCTSCTGHY